MFDIEVFQMDPDFTQFIVDQDVQDFYEDTGYLKKSRRRNNNESTLKKICTFNCLSDDIKIFLRNHYDKLFFASVSMALLDEGTDMYYLFDTLWYRPGLKKIYLFGVVASPAFACFCYYTILIKTWVFKECEYKTRKPGKSKDNEDG